MTNLLYQHLLDPLDQEQVDDAKKSNEYNIKIFSSNRTIIVCLEGVRWKIGVVSTDGIVGGWHSIVRLRTKSRV